MKRFFTSFLAGCLLLGTLGQSLPAGPAQAQSGSGENLYAVREQAVSSGGRTVASPDLSGRVVAWIEDPTGAAVGRALNLDTRQSYDLGGSIVGPIRIDGELVVFPVAEGGQARRAIRLQNLRTGEVKRLGAATSDVGALDISWPLVAYRDNRDGRPALYTYHIQTGQESLIATADVATLALSGDYLVWQELSASTPVYVQKLSAGGRRPVASGSIAGTPAVSADGAVAYFVNESDQFGARQTTLKVFTFADSLQREIARMPRDGSVSALSGPAIAGRLVVWGQGDQVLGYDLEKDRPFAVSRAVGAKRSPLVDGNTVLWQDFRNSGLVTTKDNSELYAAALSSGPAPLPPATGVPEAVEAKIEVVWPHGGLSATEADQANLEVYLFRPGSLDTVTCQWKPTVKLWKSVNNDPARLIATGEKTVGRTPSWVFNDINVAEAKDARNKIYFYVTVDGVGSTSNVWAHGSDARTYFPRMDQPAAIGSAQAVDAKIEIVWPQGDRPVTEATLVNVSASVFERGTLKSVPSDFAETVTLYRALNQGVLTYAATGRKRVVTNGAFPYPVWDFNDVDVAAARDPQNKYYFMAVVNGKETSVNVWSHGADARTYFPAKDVPTNSCA